MKRKFLALLFALSLAFLTGCGNSHPEYNSAVNENESSKTEDESLKLNNVQPENTLSDDAPKFSEYNNGHVSFTYDSEALLVTEAESVVTVCSADVRDSINNSVVIMDIQLDEPVDSEYLTSNGEILVDILFDGHFSIDNSYVSVSVDSDGFYEYEYLDNGSTLYRGKILSITDNSVLMVYCRIDDASPHLASLLSECFDDIGYLGDDPWQVAVPEYGSSDYLANLEKEAEENASQAKIVTDGTVYDSIKAITNSFSLVCMPDGSYMIDLMFESGSVNEISSEFISLCEQIYTNCFPSHSSVSFYLLVDGDIVAPITLSNGSSSEPVVFVDEYEDSIIKEYNNSSFFSSIDLQNQLDDGLN